MISTLDSSSPDLPQWNNHHHPSRLFHLPKSRSQLHHHHYHHQHQPSWSSSLSAFSLQRASAFLIDEYGNEHDPEHCQFKTLAASPTRRSTSSSSSTSSNQSITSSPPSRSPPSLRSSFRSIGPSHIPPSLSTPSSYHARPLQLLNRCLPSNPPPSTWSGCKPRQPNKAHPSKQPKNCRSSPQLQSNPPQGHHHPSKWTGKIWSHLIRPSSTSQPASSIRSNRPSPTFPSSDPTCNQPFNQPGDFCSPHTLFKRKRKLSISRTDYHHQQQSRFQSHQPRCDSPRSHYTIRSNNQHLCGMRKRLELVKLDLRFGILRTRKRFVGVWKK